MIEQRVSSSNDSDDKVSVSDILTAFLPTLHNIITKWDVLMSEL